MRRSLLYVAGIATAVPLAVAPVRAERAEWEAVRGRPIVSVRVVPGEVFDRARPGEDHFFLEWANAIHIVTRPHVVRREFDQQVGDPFDPRLAEECERNLNGLGIFQVARVTTTPVADGVEVALRTTDRWTLRAQPVLRFEGGVNELGLVVGERNVLGLGFEVAAAGVYSSDVDRASLYWRDRRVLGTRWDASVDLRYDELGRYQGYAVALPFHSDSVRWTTGVYAALRDGDRRLFEAGEEIQRFFVHEDRVESAVSLHASGKLLGRLSAFQTWRRVRGDARNGIGALGLAGSLLERTSSYRSRVDRFGPEEEIAQGWTVQLGAGADLEALGAERDRFLYRAEAQASRFFGDALLLGAVAQHHAFVDAGHLADGRLLAEHYGFWRRGGRATLAWRIGGDALLDELPYVRFDLGSDDRLRGYPARALNGTRVLYGGLEQRLFSRRRISFLRFGAVVFVDAAAAWDAGERLERAQARLGAGLGLRLGTDPSGSNLTRVDIGFGTGSVELSISSGSFFAVGRTLTFPLTQLFR